MIRQSVHRESRRGAVGAVSIIHGHGLGLAGARRLMDAFDIKSDPGGTTVTIKKILPRRASLATGAHIDRLARRLLAEPPTGPIEEAQQQNQELLRTLDELQAR